MWLAQEGTNGELRSELPSSTNRLSADELHFYQTQETQAAKKADRVPPGKVVIPDFKQHSFSIDVQEKRCSPKVQESSAKEWVTHSLSREQLRTLPLANNSRQSTVRQTHESQSVKRVDSSSPGRLVIPAGFH